MMLCEIYIPTLREVALQDELNVRYKRVMHVQKGHV